MNTEDLPLALKLRHATKKVHSLAEQTNYIKGFLRGTADIESYAQLLTDLLPVYQAMELAIVEHHKDSTPIGQFNINGLFRVEKLEQDLSFLRQQRCARPRSKPSSVAVNYANRIKEVSQNEPYKLIGHIYTRYLGDLSGGQILARIASRSMNLDANNGGLEFYNFGPKESAAKLKQRLKELINEAGNSFPTNHESISNEAVQAFHYNINLFEKLEGNAWHSFLTLLPVIGVNFTTQPRSL